MVAAATTSLPERARQGRNYDYRYVWIRDQCYAGQAVAAAGPHPLLDDAVRFVGDRLLADGPELKPAYTITGDAVPDERQLEPARLPGRHRHRRQLGQPAIPARRLRRSAAAVRRCRPTTTTSTPTAGAPPRSPPTRSSNAGANPTPASGRSTPTTGRTAA